MEENYSRDSLIAFLQFIDDRGLANANTAQALRVAASKILSDLSPEEEEDVRKIDIPLAVRRFRNRNPKALSPKSLREYQRRVTTSIREFCEYQENPTSYTGIGRGATVQKADSPETQSKRKRSVVAKEEGRPEAPPSPTQSSSGLSLSFPLRSDFLAQIVVPRDLKTDEARRLAAFIGTLASDYSPDR